MLSSILPAESSRKSVWHIEEAERFYRALAASEQKVRVGVEASGQARWFERLLKKLQFELWIGDATEIQRKRGRKQKTDRQDAQHILSQMGGYAEPSGKDDSKGKLGDPIL